MCYTILATYRQVHQWAVSRCKSPWGYIMRTTTVHLIWYRPFNRQKMKETERHAVNKSAAFCLPCQDALWMLILSTHVDYLQTIQDVYLTCIPAVHVAPAKSLTSVKWCRLFICFQHAKKLLDHHVSAYAYFFSACNYLEHIWPRDSSYLEPEHGLMITIKTYQLNYNT